MINSKLRAYYRLIKGSFVPFLLPYWDDRDFEIVQRWIKGETFPQARKMLEESIVSGAGGHWNASFFNLGRSAIQTTLEALDLPKGSEVIMPSFSCASVAMAIVQAGLVPVFVDIDDDFNILFRSVSEAYSAKVKALILPHLSGCWAKDAESIIDWSRTKNVFVIEDCAQSFGLRYMDRLAGTFADASIYSAGLGKTIFGPGGGWVICRVDEVARRISSMSALSEGKDVISKRIRDFIRLYFKSKSYYGMKILQNILLSKLSWNYSHDGLSKYGFPVYSISDIEAELALLQVSKADSIIKKQTESYGRWRDMLGKAGLSSPKFLPSQNNIHTKMIVRFVGEKAEIERAALRNCLWSNGVELESTYTPLHTRSDFSAFRHSSMVNTESQYKDCFCLPTRPSLKEEEWSLIEYGLSKIERYF